jgi:hypothetical protein
MSAPSQVNTCPIHRAAALLIRADSPVVRLPHWLDQKYQLIRRSVGRRELLRNLEVAMPTICA